MTTVSWFGDMSGTQETPQGLDDPSTLIRSEQAAGEALALYVTGPHGAARHLLPSSGFVTIGRSVECTIVLDDPSASRSNAMVELGPEIRVTDLGSANGTFIGRRRLRQGDVAVLEPGQAFTVGDSALVLRESGLKPLAADRVLTPERLLEQLEAWSSRRGSSPTTSGVVLVRARAQDPRDQHAMETVLGDLLVSSGGSGWMARFSGSWMLLVVAAPGPDATVGLARRVATAFGQWRLAAEGDTTFASGDGASLAEEVLAFAAGGGRLLLRRGTVILKDPAMQSLRRTITRVAPAPVNVLVLGETGVGKDVFASMLHELSPRAAKPFLRINCSSLPDALLESELFGFERGAFTGAASAKAGLLEQADGGTVFLDEIGELPFPLQAKLLLTIESRAVTRLGAVRPRAIDVRFVAATNRDIAADVEQGRFRRDLLFRLNSITLTVPALRDRPSEIEPLAQLFISDACARFHVDPLSLSPAALKALLHHDWPGNVRELRNVIERAVLLVDGAVINASDLGLDATTAVDEASPRATAREPAIHPAAPPDARDVSDGSQDVERQRIEVALSQCGGNQSRAAQLLGMPRRTLVRKIARLGLPRPRRE